MKPNLRNTLSLKADGHSAACAVIAFSVVTGVDFLTVDAELRARGARKSPTSGTFTHRVLPHGFANRAGQFLGKTFTNALGGIPTRHGSFVGDKGIGGLKYVRRQTVRAFIAEHPTGKFFINTPTHSVAVVDGVLYDNLKEGSFRRFVESAYEVHDFVVDYQI